MPITEVSYTIRLTLGDYQHEELSAKYTLDPTTELGVTADKMMSEARKVCLEKTTAYLNKAKGKDGRST